MSSKKSKKEGKGLVNESKLRYQKRDCESFPLVLDISKREFSLGAKKKKNCSCGTAKLFPP